MIKTVFHSDDMPPQNRLTRFDEFQVNSEYPMRVRSEEPENFRATARALDLAAVNVVELTCSSADVRRTPRMIRDSDPELYSIVFPLRGRVDVVQADREATLGARDFALYDSQRPSHIRIAAEGETATLVRAQLPRVLLPLSACQVDRILAVPMSGHGGVGALLTQFLTSLTAGSASYRPADIPRLSGVAVDLVNATIAHHIDAYTEIPADSRRRALFLRIEAFVQQHLHDPQMSPRSIAAAHHISVSYLHRIFRDHGTTVSTWIRRQRLERARRDLADPMLRMTPVHQIAARWGFTDHASFTRAFNAAFDLPPRDYRQHALSALG
jgi:AraC-like DNA-binding protein